MIWLRYNVRLELDIDMDDQPEEDLQAIHRCPRCDSVVPPGATKCLMCGLAQSTPPPAGPRLEESAVEDTATVETGSDQSLERAAEEAVSFSTDAPEDVALPSDKDVRPAQPLARISSPVTVSPTALPEVTESWVREHRSFVWFWLVTVLVVMGLGGAWLALRDQAPAVMAAFMPSPTPLPVGPSPTPSVTPTASPTPPPTVAPTETPVPLPTSTPRDPRVHSVGAGETLFGLSLLYRVSAESIAAANGFNVGAPIQADQSLLIPWPTPTPPLESVLFDLNGEQVVADVTDCEIITIQSGDSAYALSANRGVPLEAIIAVNRQTMESIQLLQPGDTLCIPRIVLADTLPPTPGPSPTPMPTSLPVGPTLLYPVEGASVDDSSLLLQWVAVKDLTESEWYMVEMQNLEQDNALPWRGFTRDTSYRVPPEWRPVIPEPREMRWQVSIVQVTGRRSDGTFTYAYGGESGRPAHFTWMGSVPTSTPTTTPTATLAPDSN